ncbi:ABC-type amino acid transport substrate-binding protein [Bradyrhizobium sp. USDA 3364]
MRARLAGAATALLLGMTAAAHAADDPLKVCLDEDLPPLSAHHRGKPDSGFDVALAQVIAERLGRPLKIQWFESKLDEDSSPALEANALLSDGRCSLVGSYALTTDSLKAPGVTTAKLPDFDGATREDRRRRIPIGVLAPSRPYVYSPMSVVLGPNATDKLKDRKITDIGDLAGLRLTIESGTLGDAILMTFDKGKLIEDITHLVPGRSDLLGESSSAANTTPRCSTCAGSTPTALNIPTRRSRPRAIIIRSAPTAVMSRSKPTRRCWRRSTTCWPICKPRAPLPSSARPQASPGFPRASRSSSAMSG